MHDDNPYDSPKGESTTATSRPKLSALRIALEYSLAGVFSSIVSTTIYTWFWSRQEVANQSRERFAWAPIDDLPSMLLMIPLGWVLFSLMSPVGWFYWAGCLYAAVKPRRYLLLVSIAGGVCFGFFWPKYFVALMGV